MTSTDLELEWDRLATRCGAAPFLRPAFFNATARCFSIDGTLEPACARDGADLVAVLPLVRRGSRLAALRGDHTPRFDMIGSPDASALLWRVLRDDLAWHTLELAGVPEGSPLATQLVDLARADGFVVEVVRRSGSPFLPLHEFDQKLPGHFRRNLAARRRKLGEVELERVTVDDASALDDMFRLEAAAWKGEAGTAIASSEGTLRFYREVAAAFARTGALALTFLRSDGRRIAAHFALDDGRTYYLLKPGYDPDYARFGPGHLHVYEAALDARRRGLVELDFLGQEMDWKRSWTSLVRPQLRIEIYRPTRRGLATHALQYRVRPVLGAMRRWLARAPSAESAKMPG